MTTCPSCSHIPTEFDYQCAKCGRDTRIAKPKRKTPEYDLQRSCRKWFGTQYPKLKRLFIHIRNEGKRTNRQGAYGASLGVQSGMPDVLIAVNPPLYVEFKASGGSLSATQHEMHDLLRAVGNRVEVCRSLDAFVAVVTDHMKMTVIS